MLYTICRFIHKYEMVGRILEESNKVINAIIAEIAKRLRSIPTTTTRIKVTNAQTQSNINREILEHNIELKEAITGKKKGHQKTRSKVVAILSMVKEYVVLKEGKYLKLSSENLIS